MSSKSKSKGKSYLPKTSSRTKGSEKQKKRSVQQQETDNSKDFEFGIAMKSCIKDEDIERILSIQRRSLKSFSKTNELLGKFNDFSSSKYDVLQHMFVQHTRLLVELKNDLTNVFLRIRRLKVKLQKQNPEAFEATFNLRQALENELEKEVPDKPTYDAQISTSNEDIPETTFPTEAENSCIVEIEENAQLKCDDHMTSERISMLPQDEQDVVTKNEDTAVARIDEEMVNIDENTAQCKSEVVSQEYIVEAPEFDGEIQALHKDNEGIHGDNIGKKGLHEDNLETQGLHKDNEGIYEDSIVKNGLPEDNLETQESHKDNVEVVGTHRNNRGGEGLHEENRDNIDTEGMRRNNMEEGLHEDNLETQGILDSNDKLGNDETENTMEQSMGKLGLSVDNRDFADTEGDLRIKEPARENLGVNERNSENEN